METRRKDTHRPGALNPADYSYTGCFVNSPPVDLDGNETEIETAFWEVPGYEPLTFAEALSKTASPDRAYPGETDRCDRCGQRINHAAVYRHDPTGQFVAFGYRCADGALGYESRRAAEAARQHDLLTAVRKDAAEEAQRRGRLEATRRLHPSAYAILDGYTGPNRFIARVASKLAETGELSENQASAVTEAHIKDEEERERRASGEVQPVPEGKGRSVEGTVLKAEERGNPYAGRWGRQYKIALTVKDDRGFVVWGYAPEALYYLTAPGSEVDREARRDVERGDRVRFVANLEPKKNDPYFGFFRQPRKAEVVVFHEHNE